MNPQRQKVALTVKPSDFLNSRVFLQRLYEALAHDSKSGSSKASYTYKQFAQDLGFGPTNIMHQLVQGRRPLSLKTIDRLIDAIGIKRKERIYLRTLGMFEQAKTVGERDKHFQKLVRLKQELLPNELDRATLEYLSAWYHPVIRELICMDDAEPSAEWVASRLRPGLDLRFIKDSLELLQRIGFIEFDEENLRYRQLTQNISTGPRVRGLGIVGFHQEMIEQGKEALTKVEASRRNFGALTFSCSEETAQRIKVAVDRFQDEVLEMLKSEDSDQVYQMNIQFFPFTHKK